MTSVPDQSERNRRIIEEFRANRGRVSGRFDGAHMLLLTTSGAKSGRRYTTPLMYLPDGDRMLVFASHGGAPTSPAWYHNMVASGGATVEVGSETFDVTAAVLSGDERDRLYAIQAGLYSAFADYQAKTSRRIPVVALRRRAD